MIHRILTLTVALVALIAFKAHGAPRDTTENCVGQGTYIVFPDGGIHHETSFRCTAVDCSDGPCMEILVETPLGLGAGCFCPLVEEPGCCKLYRMYGEPYFVVWGACTIPQCSCFGGTCGFKSICTPVTTIDPATGQLVLLHHVCSVWSECVRAMDD